jgi:hypothetical protein
MTIENILPEMSKNTCSFVLQNYSFDDLDIRSHDPDKFDVIHIHSKHMNRIDVDQWIVAVRTDVEIVKATLYGDYDLLTQMHDQDVDVIHYPIVVTNHDLNNNYAVYNDNLTDDKLPFDNIKYIVNDEVQKANIIKRGLAFGFMHPVFVGSLLERSLYVASIDTADISYYMVPSFVLINKASKYKQELLDIFSVFKKEIIDTRQVITA